MLGVEHSVTVVVVAGHEQGIKSARPEHYTPSSHFQFHTFTHFHFLSTAPVAPFISSFYLCTFDTMRFFKSLLFAIPLIGAVIAAPTKDVEVDAVVARSSDLVARHYTYTSVCLDVKTQLVSRLTATVP